MRRLCFAVLLLSFLSAACGDSNNSRASDGGVGPDGQTGDGSTDADPDAGGAVDGSCTGPTCSCETPPCEPIPGCEGLSPLTRDDSLKDFAPFRAARVEWKDWLTQEAAAPGLAPYPPIAARQDPMTTDFWAWYVIAWQASGEPVDFAPFYVESTADMNLHDGRMRNRATLILGKSDPASLLRLTDFSSSGGEARYSAVCERYLATAEGAAAAPLRLLCDQLGTLVRTSEVADLKIDGLKLFRARECALPSLAYGSFDGSFYDSPASEIAFTWPNYLARPPEFWQPCVGAFVHAVARDTDGAELGRGWMMVKAVADLAAVGFPEGEADPEYGDLEGVNGAPRGEYVSTRQFFEGGLSMYLGASPIWLLEGPLTETEVAQSLGGFAISVCDLSQTPPTTPCILPPQPPFVYPSANPVWTRQTLDASRLGATLDENARSPWEEPWGTLGLYHPVVDALKFINATDFTKASVEALPAYAEQLSAMWHAPRLYQGRHDEFLRMRVEVLALNEQYALAIPDQGYVQLGTPTAELLEELWTRDLVEDFDSAQPLCEKELFVVQDIVAP